MIMIGLKLNERGTQSMVFANGSNSIIIIIIIILNKYYYSNKSHEQCVVLKTCNNMKMEMYVTLFKFAEIQRTETWHYISTTQFWLSCLFSSSKRVFSLPVAAPSTSASFASSSPSSHQMTTTVQRFASSSLLYLSVLNWMKQR